MKVLQVILAHTESQEIFDRHLPIWMANNATTMVVAREGFGVKTDLEQVFIGKRGRGGPEAGRAYAKLLRFISLKDYDLFILNEYDSFCLSREIPIPVCPLGGSLFLETDPKTVFKAKHYVHFPVVFTRAGLHSVARASHKIPEEAEGGHCDRYLGYLCELAIIPISDWRSMGIGFSQNTIEPHQIKDAADAATNGAVMFHGCKSKECLQAIATAHLNRTLGKSIDLGKIAIRVSL